MDAETYQLWLQTKAKLGEVRDAEALKKLCQAHQSGAVKKGRTETRQAPTIRTAGVVLRRELLAKAEHRCQFRQLQKLNVF